MNGEEMIVEFSVENSKVISLAENWNKPGIWIVYGKTEENVAYTCLEVGQTGNIKDELERDFKLITKGCCKERVKVRRFREWSKSFF